MLQAGIVFGGVCMSVRRKSGKLLIRNSSSSSDNGTDSIPSNIAPRVNKQMCSEKAVQQTMNRNLDKNSAV